MTWKEIFEKSGQLRTMMIQLILQALDGSSSLSFNETIRCCWFNAEGELTEFHIKWILHDPMGLLKKDEKVTDPEDLYAMLHFPATGEDWLYPLTTELLDDHLMLICQHIGDGEFDVK